MHRIIFFLATIGFGACNSNTINYYIVRHAEKAIVDSSVKSSAVPLSGQGKKRAEGLKNKLQNNDIKYIYSTNTVRTKATAEPLSKAIDIPVRIYDGNDTHFVQALKKLDGNVVIIGHSNTVDDLVNGLTGKFLLNDLPDTQFGNLFIVHRKGNVINYEVKRFEPPD
jgi:phosphohistidine phosphatase SixA